MSNSNTILVSEYDLDRLASVLQRAEPVSTALLERELDRATIVPHGEVPGDVVSMGSTVAFRDLDTGEESTVTLVYPQDASIADGRISILAPVGAALIGLRVGQSIEWPVPRGANRKLEVVAVRRDAVPVERQH